MKKLFAVLAIASFVFLIAGCSGGSEDTSSNQNKSADAANSVESTDSSGSSTTATPVATTRNNTSTKETTPRKMKYDKGSIPKDIEHNLDNGIPIVVAFLQSNEIISERLEPEIAQIVADYKGLLMYYKYTDNQSKEVTKLSLSLGVNYLPHISIIDSGKNIIFEKSGFIDSQYLNHEVYNAVYGDTEPN